MDKIVVKLDNGSYVLPEEISYRQYYKVNKLFNELEINFKDIFNVGKEEGSNNIEILIGLGTLMSKLLESDKLPVMFSTLLIREKAGEPLKWVEAEAMSESYIGDMYDLTDGTMLDILQSYFLALMSVS